MVSSIVTKIESSVSYTIVNSFWKFSWKSVHCFERVISQTNTVTHAAKNLTSWVEIKYHNDVTLPYINVQWCSILEIRVSRY